jgi:FKBP-type peptidyl-prolyl cis-trans isomerase FkpA
MSLRFRGLAAWMAVCLIAPAALLLPANAPAQDKPAQPKQTQPKQAQQKPSQAKPAQEKPAQETSATMSDRSKVSYMVGSDVGRSIAAVGPDLDLAAFERAVKNAFSGGKPLLTDEESQTVGRALMQRIGERSGKALPGTAPGTKAPPVDKAKVGFLVGTDVGRSLSPIQEELDLPTFLQAVKTLVAGGKPALSDADMDQVRESFSKRMEAKEKARIAEAITKNAAEGAAFLSKNKQSKGVISTASGLQYMVLRQGTGKRPRSTDRVRVNYRGTLLDGSEFDSSYSRGQPAEFALDQVIAGWTEGLALMPVGAKYRFWIPSAIGYGERGSPPSIGPNATLVFDVELLDVLGAP